LAFFSKLLTRMRPEGTEGAAPHSADLRDTFALRLLSVLSTLGVPANYDADAFALRLSSGSVSWLGNRFEEWLRTDPKHHEALLLQIAASIFEASQPSPLAQAGDARAHLRPRVRQRAHHVIVGLQLQADGVDGWQLSQTFLPLTDDLGVEVVYDTPTNIVSVPVERLEGWGLDPSQALEVAIDNLRRADAVPFRCDGDGVWLASCGDCYDSARLLLVDEIAALPLAGEPVALPANRDNLAITGSENLGGLYRLLQLAVSALDLPRLDTLQPVVLRDGVWVDWLPQTDHPMREAFYELAVRSRGNSYAELKDLLDAAADSGPVASYGMLRPHDDSLPWSHAVWPTSSGLLPESDLVSVLHPGGARYVVVPRRWLLEVVGHLMEPVPDLHPPYHTVRGAPDLSQWEVLAARKVFEGEVGGTP